MLLRQKAAEAAGKLALRMLPLGIRIARTVLPFLIRAAAHWRMRFGRPRTLWAVQPIIMLPLLAQCDRLLGFRSQSLVYNTYHITHDFDINLKKIFFWAHGKGYAPAKLFHEVVLALAMIRYDTFNYFYDRGLLIHEGPLGHREEEFLKLKAYDKRIYTYAYGADTRTRDTTLALGPFNMCMECPEPGRFCICDEERGTANVALIQRYANAAVAMSDMIHYVPNYTMTPYLPIDTSRFRYVGCDWRPGRTLRVAHAPNHPHFKGTSFLLDAIERLRREGHDIELVKVQGVPNTEVIRLFESSDIVAEQFAIGAHGYTAIEAMLLGKPVLCYLRSAKDVAYPDHCPIINTSPTAIYDVLLECLRGRFDLADLGHRGRIYAEHFYSIEATAISLGELYLASARFPPRIVRMIETRIARLRTKIPPLIQKPPPISFAEAERMLAA